MGGCRAREEKRTRQEERIEIIFDTWIHDQEVDQKEERDEEEEVEIDLKAAESYSQILLSDNLVVVLRVR